MAFNIPYHPTRYGYHFFRRLVIQPLFWAFFFLSPVLGIYQLDVIHQTVVFMGNSYPMATATMIWLPPAFFGCVMIIAALSALYGRLFCGWICPHNTLTEWTTPIRMLIGLGKRPFRLKQWEKAHAWVRPVSIAASLVWAGAVTWIISVLFSFYFVPVDWYLGHLVNGTVPPVLVWGHGVMILIGLFMVYVGHEFCRSACPYGLSQSLSAYLTGKFRPMEIAYQSAPSLAECGSCRACEASCPVDLDPRKPENLIVGEFPGCFNCGECIDACHYVRAAQDKPRLLGFKLPF